MTIRPALTALLLTAAATAPASDLVPTLGDEVAAGAVHPQNQYQCDLRAAPDDTTWAITAKSRTQETETVILLSADAGATWRARVIPKSSDPDCIFSADGALHVSVISKRDGDAIGYLRSGDGGTTWDQRRALPLKVDHPHLGLDRSADSPRTGALYVIGRKFSNDGIAIARSLDGGDSWSVTEHDLGDQFNRGFVHNLAVTADGTLLAALRSKNNIRSEDGSYAGNTVHLACLRSTDGGETVEAVDLGTLDNGASSGPGGMFGISLAHHAFADGERTYYLSSRKRPAPEPAGLWLRHSDNRGATWSEPRAIHPSIPEGLGVGQADVIANAHGQVCIRFYATITELHGQEATKYPPYHVFVVASADGGATFGEPVALNAEPLPYSPWGYQRRVLGADQNHGCALGDGSFLLPWTDTRDRHPDYVVYLRRVRFE